MDKIKREIFEAWLKSCNWFKINEKPNPTGPQDHYLTPAGEFVIAQYNLDGELQQVVKPMPPMPQAAVIRSPLQFKGDSQMPPGFTG